MMGNLSPASQSLIDQYSVAEFPASQSWLDQLRLNGIKTFSNTGLPTPRTEEWKYTNLKVLDNVSIGQAKDISVSSSSLAWLPKDIATHKLVFVNGQFSQELSDIGDLEVGMKVLPLSDALLSNSDLMESLIGQNSSFEKAPVLALNTAFIKDGVVIIVEKVEVAKPIEVIFVSQGGKYHHPRNLILLKDNACATILERHIGMGQGGYLANCVFEVFIEGGSHLKHNRLLDDTDEGVNLSLVKVKIGKDGTYDSFIMSIGGKLSRSEIHVSCEAAGAHANLNGVYLGRDSQHMDHSTLINHLAPNTTSVESYKGALDDKARGVFQGAIVVADGADGTDGRMSNRTLLLSDDAEIDAKPQLEIYADDVQCAHGFTAGELDEDSLFYLRTRGIPDNQARSMLVEGFLTEVVEIGVDEIYQNIFKTKISNWMNE